MYNCQLKDIIKNAYALTSASNDSKELFNNLKYRIDTAEKVNSNSIKFEYKTDEPLNQVNIIIIINRGNITQRTLLKTN